MAKALRNIERLAGKSYKAGDVIPEAVIANISPQVLRSLVDAHTIEVAGMESKGGSTGGHAHLTARLDRQGEEVKKLQAANAALEKRLSALEGKKTAKPAVAPKAPAATQ